MDIKYIIVFLLSGVAALLVFSGFEMVMPDMSAFQMVFWGIVLLIIAHQYMTRGASIFYSWQFWIMLIAAFMISVVV